MPAEGSNSENVKAVEKFAKERWHPLNTGLKPFFLKAHEEYEIYSIKDVDYLVSIPPNGYKIEYKMDYSLKNLKSRNMLKCHLSNDQELNILLNTDNKKQLNGFMNAIGKALLWSSSLLCRVKTKIYIAFCSHACVSFCGRAISTSVTILS